MAIKRSRKANPNFNMSSMTDIVFLLLIFFMVRIYVYVDITIGVVVNIRIF